MPCHVHQQEIVLGKAATLPDKNVIVIIIININFLSKQNFCNVFKQNACFARQRQLLKAKKANKTGRHLRKT